MLLAEHPFHVLGVSPRTGKIEILQRAEELIARSPENALAECQFRVTHPTKRLEAEVSWFPGVAPARIRQIVAAINTDSGLPTNLEEKLAGIDALGRFNALVYWLGIHKDINAPAWGLALYHLSKCSQSFVPGEIAVILNADRSAARFPVISDVSGVENAISKHFEATVAFLADRLMQCSRHSQVLTLIVERETDGGESLGSDFITRFVDRYQIQVQPILERLAEGIAARCDNLVALLQKDRLAPIDSPIGDIARQLSEWDSVAQPIQLLMRARGLRDAHSIAVAKRVRSMAVRLANDFELHQEAKRLTLHLLYVFKEVPEILERIQSDSGSLDEIIAKKDDRRKREEERQKATELDIVIGKDRLQLKNGLIAYKGKELPLDDVSHLRWGIFKAYTNGVRTRREFTIWVGSNDDRREMVIECVRFLESEEMVAQRYSTIVEKLWRAVGFRILLEIASKVMEGQALTFGEATLISGGIWLPKKKWLSSEPYFARWEELRKGTAAGELRITSNKEPKAAASLSLRGVDNAVILDRLLDILWEDGNYAKLRSGTLFNE